MLAPTIAVADALRGRGHPRVVVWGRGADAAFGAVHERAPGSRLVLVGDGPARAKLENAAPPGVTFLGELHTARRGCSSRPTIRSPSPWRSWS